MKKTGLLLLLLLLFSLPGALAYEYQAPQACTYAQAWPGESASFQAVSLKTDHALYYISAEIDASARDAFIDRQEALLAALGETGFTVYVLPQMQAHGFLNSRTLFLSPLEDGGMGQAIALLQAVHGEFSNYGLIYGAADALCKEAGLPGHILRFNERGMLKFCNNEDNLHHFLLYYPSFTEDYTDKTLIPFIKDFAVRFYQYAKDKNQDLLALPLEAFSSAYVPLINAFIASLPSESGLHDYLPPLRFAYGGPSCPLMIESCHGKWLLHPDFSDTTLYFNWADSYADVLYRTIWNAEDELDKIDQAMAMRLDGLTFLLGNRQALGISSNYAHYAGNGPLPITGLSTLSHEYVHACLQVRLQSPPSWFLAELAASYFELQSEYSAHDSLYYTIWNLPAAQREYWMPVLEVIREGKKLDYASEPEELFGYLCFAHQQYDLFTPSSRTLNSIRSFAGFLKEIYGDKQICALFLAEDPSAVLGKSWETLRLEWVNHLKSLYGDGAAL